MTRASDKRRRTANRNEEVRGNRAIPILRVKKGTRLKTINAAARRAFTAADLQKYTEVESGIPAAQVLAELEALDRKETLKRKRKTMNDRSR